ncbi:MAG: hypothetical protein QW416_01930 [Candidatus Nitrosocaldaceae archaeon]
MNRIKKISMQLIDKYPDLFSNDYNANKDTLEKIAIFRSKELKNKVAGYITSYINDKTSNHTDSI